MTWKTLTERDCRDWNLNEVDPCDMEVWRSSMRSAICVQLASYLERSPLMWMKLLHLNLNLSDDDDDDGHVVALNFFTMEFYKEMVIFL